MSDPKRSAPTEWPTLLLLAGCYAAWALATTWLAALWLPAGIALATLAIALHSSLSHEMIHGHPFPDRRVNEALVFPALTLVVPYRRFRDTHLEHHRDSLLTDPYDDPESNYWDPAVWQGLTRWQQAILRVNNTLAGRLLIGPAVGTWAFTLSDLRAIRAGRAGVLSGWLWHLPALVPVALWLGHVAQMPVWAYLLSAYMGLSILKIRTFLEHQAHERARGRTVITTLDSPPFAEAEAYWSLGALTLMRTRSATIPSNRHLPSASVAASRNGWLPPWMFTLAPATGTPSASTTVPASVSTAGGSTSGASVTSASPPASGRTVATDQPKPVASAWTPYFTSGHRAGMQ